MISRGIFRVHRPVGFALATIHVLGTAALFAARLHSVATNPGDAGASAMPLFLPALPWVLLVPKWWLLASAWSWMACPVLWCCTALNAGGIFAIASVSAGVVRSTWSRCTGGRRRGPD